MTKKKHPRHRKDLKKIATRPAIDDLMPVEETKKKLELVLNCDSVGSQEAIIAGIHAIQEPKVAIKVIHSGVGSITKSDLFMALTGSRLVLGFDVGIAPNIKRSSVEQGIEIRLHEVIYKLIDDVQKIAGNLVPKEIEEKVTGRAKVIALFKSSRKAIILGCDVLEGTLALGKRFRVVSAMGTVYTGKIESLHIEKDAVKEARVGQQVGLKILGFKKAKVGDLVECYEKAQVRAGAPWRPKGGVFRP